MPNVPRTVPEKPKNRKKVLTRLWRYLYQYKWHLLAALLLTFSSNLLALIGPTLSGRAIDAIGVKAGGVDFQTVIFYCILMIIFYALSSLLSYILSVLMIHLSQKVVYQMREDVFHRLSLLPISLNWHIGRVKPANPVQSAVLFLNFLRLKEHFDHLPHFLLLLCHSFRLESNFGLTVPKCLST